MPQQQGLTLATMIALPPPPVGFHHTTTQRQRANVGGTWSRYATRRE
jgi:hypothetical protein